MKPKRNPGEWLREKRLDKIFNIAILVMVGYGYLAGAILVPLAVIGVRFFSELIYWVMLLPGVAPLAIAWYKSKHGWRLSDMRKGARAEETIGQAIEYTLTRDGCAVAHSVEEIARVGDIDHLVATPKGLWVIETKSGRVPQSKFPETLRRIAANVETVREWAPPGTQVTGCLVFANELEKPPISTGKSGKETIRIFGKYKNLTRELRKEARETGDSRILASRVWKLGKLEAADQPDPDG